MENVLNGSVGVERYEDVAVQRCLGGVEAYSDPSGSDGSSIVAVVPSGRCTGCLGLSVVPKGKRGEMHF